MKNKRNKVSFSEEFAIKIWLKAVPGLLVSWEKYCVEHERITFDEYVQLPFSDLVVKSVGKEE